jgi:hypothetical protein
MKKQTAPLGLLLFFFFLSTTSGWFRSADSMVAVCVYRSHLMLAPSPPLRPNYMDIGNRLVPQVFGRRWLSFGAPCRCYCWRHGEKKSKKSKVVGRQVSTPPLPPPPFLCSPGRRYYNS